MLNNQRVDSRSIRFSWAIPCQGEKALEPNTAIARCSQATDQAMKPKNVKTNHTNMVASFR
jgi:hypothetical protein